MEPRNQYVKEMRQKIREAGLNLDKITDSFPEIDATVRREAFRQFHSAKDKLNEIGKKLDTMAEVDEEAWLLVKSDLDVMWQDVKRIIRNAQS